MIFFNKDDNVNLAEKIKKTSLIKYYDYLDVFNKADSDILLIFKPEVNYYIELNDGCILKDLRYNPLYKICLKKAEAYKKYIVDNLRKSFIESNYIL